MEVINQLQDPFLEHILMEETGNAPGIITSRLKTGAAENMHVAKPHLHSLRLLGLCAMLES